MHQILIAYRLLMRTLSINSSASYRLPASLPALPCKWKAGPGAQSSQLLGGAEVWLLRCTGAGQSGRFAADVGVWRDFQQLHQSQLPPADQQPAAPRLPAAPLPGPCAHGAGSAADLHSCPPQAQDARRPPSCGAQRCRWGRWRWRGAAGQWLTGTGA